METRNEFEKIINEIKNRNKPKPTTQQVLTNVFIWVDGLKEGHYQRIQLRSLLKGYLEELENLSEEN